eukprot:scaffold53427_cov25-Tisochrysis_lutea.AAC.1
MGRLEERVARWGGPVDQRRRDRYHRIAVGHHRRHRGEVGLERREGAGREGGRRRQPQPPAGYAFHNARSA